MAQLKYIKKTDVESWLSELGRENTVYVPAYDGETLVFRPFAPGQEMVTEYQATVPPKKTVFPRSETLIDFTYTKDEEDLSRIMIDAKETLPSGTTVVFGSRPCDVRGFTMIDRVYLSEKSTDIYYKTRRENTAFITLACRTPDSTCFCHWLESGPCDAAGSDVLAIPVDDGFLLEAVSDRGEQLLDSRLISLADGRRNEVEKFCQEAAESLGSAPDLAAAPEKLLQVFDSLDFWEEVSAKCLSCGACTYLCPSCYCFNITDENQGMKGKRIRSWDNCMSPLFTLEASGHNPRPTKAHRLRNRVGHKFSYYPAIHGVTSCCGCGRCIKSCPVGIDIREIVLKAIDFQPEAAQE